MSQVTVISGVERRRRWNAEQKQSVVAAASEPGANISEVARQADVRTSQIYRWRRELNEDKLSFAAVTVAPDRAGSRFEAPDVPALVIEVGGAVVRVGIDASPMLITTVLRALR